MGEFDIRARRPHGDGEGSAVDPDFQGLLDSQGFRAGDGAAGGDVFGSAPCGYPTHGSNLITTALDTGVLDLRAVWSNGIKGLVSG